MLELKKSGKCDKYSASRLESKIYKKSIKKKINKQSVINKKNGKSRKINPQPPLSPQQIILLPLPVQI